MLDLSHAEEHSTGEPNTAEDLRLLYRADPCSVALQLDVARRWYGVAAIRRQTDVHKARLGDSCKRRTDGCLEPSRARGAMRRDIVY